MKFSHNVRSSTIKMIPRRRRQRQKERQRHRQRKRKRGTGTEQGQRGTALYEGARPWRVYDALFYTFAPAEAETEAEAEAEL